jgi:hypothetical protein
MPNRADFCAKIDARMLFNTLRWAGGEDWLATAEPLTFADQGAATALPVLVAAPVPVLELVQYSTSTS